MLVNKSMGSGNRKLKSIRKLCILLLPGKFRDSRRRLTEFLGKAGLEEIMPISRI